MQHMIFGPALAAALACGAPNAIAQESVVQPPSSQTPAAAAATPIIVELAETVSSKTRKRGDTFAIRLVSAVAVDGRSLPAGVTGVGQVVDAAPAGPLGRPAKLLLAARYLDFEGRRIPLRGFQLGAAGHDETTAVMVGTFVPYAGLLALFIHGGEIEMPAGTMARAKLVTTAAQSPAPIIAPAQPSTSTAMGE